MFCKYAQIVMILRVVVRCNEKKRRETLWKGDLGVKSGRGIAKWVEPHVLPATCTYTSGAHVVS